MKRLLLFLSLTVAIASGSYALIDGPRHFNGEPLNSLDWVGARPCVVDATVGTNPVGCSTAPAIVYGIIATAITNTHYLVFRDTNTTNLNSATFTIVYASGSFGQGPAGPNTSVMIKFPVPLEFINGVSVNPSVAPSAGSMWTVLYRVRKSTTSE